MSSDLDFKVKRDNYHNFYEHRSEKRVFNAFSNYYIRDI